MSIIMKTFKGGVDINLRIMTGLYILSQIGGVGKTYLCRLLYERVYSDINSLKNYITLYLFDEKGVVERHGFGKDLVILDNADMYSDKLKNIIDSYDLSKTTVAVDLKNAYLIEKMGYTYKNMYVDIDSREVNVCCL